MHKRGFVHIALLVTISAIAFVVLVAAGSALIILQSQPRTVTTSDTSAWKTYRNEQYGFEFKYPNKLTIKETKTDSIPGASMLYSLQLVGLGSAPHSYFRVEVWKENGGAEGYTGGSIYEFFKRWAQGNELRPAQTVVNRRLNENISGVETYGPGNEGFGYQDDFYFTRDSLLWHIELDPVYEGRITQDELNMRLVPILEYDAWPLPPMEIDKSTYQHILSTFKFIESGSAIDTSNWQTYRNEEYGFEFKYPVGMTLGGFRNVANPKLFTFWIDYQTNRDLLFAVYPVTAYENLAEYRKNSGSNTAITLGDQIWYRFDVDSTIDYIQYYLEKINLYRLDVYDSNIENVVQQILSTFKFIPK